MVSMKDIAQRCGVSVASVSKALNGQPDIGEETRKRIEQVAKELGYTKVKNVSSHGQAIYYNPRAPKGLRYISADIDSHSGGIWKAGASIKDLIHKESRTGTFNWNLTIKIGE